MSCNELDGNANAHKERLIPYMGQSPPFMGIVNEQEWLLMELLKTLLSLKLAEGCGGLGFVLELLYLVLND